MKNMSNLICLIYISNLLQLPDRANMVLPFMEMKNSLRPLLGEKFSLKSLIISYFHTHKYYMLQILNI